MPSFAITNPNAYAVPELVKRHRYLMRRFQRAGRRFGVRQKEELWKIEQSLNVRTRPALKPKPKPTIPK